MAGCWNRTDRWHDERSRRPGHARTGTHRLRRLVAVARGAGGVRRRRQRTAALCHPPADGRDQFLVLPPPPGGHLRPVGGERARGFPLRGETAARDPSWFTADVDTLLSDHGIARVAADPARVPAAAVPGGDRTWSYWRWHGQPQIYRSPYSEQALAGLAQHLQREAAAQRRAWCVLDNTALGHATGNALHLQALLQENAHA